MIACAWFPNWPIQRLLHARPELKGQVAVHERERIVAATDPNLVGLPVAEVTVYLEEHDLEADLAQLEILARWCDQFSPIVGIEGDSLLLDVTGLPFDAGQVAKAIRQEGFVARVAVAKTVGAAWALAHFEEPLPVAALRLDESTLEMLAALGIRFVSELQTLPRDQLASRFENVVRRLDQLSGAIVEPIVPYREPPEIVVERNLEYPLESRQMIAALCDDMLAEVAHELSLRQQGAARLELMLNDARFVIGLFQPSDSPSYLRELVEMQLERVQLAEAVTNIGLAVLMAAPLRPRQRELFEDGHDRERQFGLFVDRIRCRSPALRAVLVADAQPEHAFRYQLFERIGEARVARPERARQHSHRRSHALRKASGRATPKDRETSRQHQSKLSPSWRPLLVEPRPIPVDAISGSGPPQQFSVRGETYRTQQAWGPERILTGWWRGGYIRRDYYRVETTAGSCYWLFRARQRWFLHGVF
jgi:protein ImuB